jgi:phage-related minor tail protein
VQGQARAAVATRTRLGIVSEEELITRGLADLQRLRADGFIRSEEEMAQAEHAMRKEVQATIEALQVRNSDMPALTRLAQDSQDLARNLDQDLTGALASSTSGIIEMAQGTKTLSAGLADLSTRLLEAIANALLMKSVVGPAANAISGSLSSLFGGPGAPLTLTPSAMGNVFGPGGILAFARGGVVSRPMLFPFAGGTGLMGERGPEAIMPLSRLPDGRLGVTSAGGAGPVTVNVINAPAGVERVRSAPDGNGGTRVDVELRRMVEDMGERMLSDRGSPWARALSRTLGVNPARTIA